MRKFNIKYEKKLLLSDILLTCRNPSPVLVNDAIVNTNDSKTE